MAQAATELSTHTDDVSIPALRESAESRIEALIAFLDATEEDRDLEEDPEGDELDLYEGDVLDGCEGEEPSDDTAFFGISKPPTSHDLRAAREAAAFLRKLQRKAVRL
jgi:hypothetical protein